MRWADIDLEEAVWRIAKTKNGEAMTVPLTPEAVLILKERKQQKIVNAVWVFPGSGETGHLVEPKRAWANLVETAGLTGLRIHDLRRTLGSWQARQGSSLTIIGKSLGHKSQTATAIYSRLDLDPVRESVESATAAIVEAGRGSKR
jgi:integrase